MGGCSLAVIGEDLIEGESLEVFLGGRAGGGTESLEMSRFGDGGADVESLSSRPGVVPEP